MTDADWDLVLDVVMRGAFNGFRAVAPWFRDRERSMPRRVVNIGSVAHHGGIGGANYSAAKAGLVGLTKAMADEWAAFGVTVNAVAPGFIEVGLSEGSPRRRGVRSPPAYPWGGRAHRRTWRPRWPSSARRTRAS